MLTVEAETGLSEAQVVRLAVTYAALDISDQVRPEHLAAASAVWEYCLASARFIFGNETGDPVADEIMRALRDRPNGMTRTQINRLFGSNRRADQIGAALDNLMRLGRLTPEKIETGGRPAERWRAI